MPGSSLSCWVLLHRTRHVAIGGTRSRHCRYSVSRSHLGHCDLRAGLWDHCSPRPDINGIVRARPLRSDYIRVVALDTRHLELGKPRQVDVCTTLIVGTRPASVGRTATTLQWKGAWHWASLT